MILRPDSIYKCPNCGSLFKRGSLISGNTFGAKLYSDGKTDAPMLPEFPVLTICRKCNTLLDIRALKEIEKAEIHSQHIEYKYIPNANFLEMNDLYRALEKFPEYELDIRLDIWWKWNRSTILEEKQYEDNCRALLKLLDPKDENQKIMMAELWRNLGEFNKCMELINSLPVHNNRNGNSNWNELKWIFERECKRENKHIFRIDNYRDEVYRQEREQEELKDERWKVCPTGHCYQHTRHHCTFCGYGSSDYTTYVDRVAKDTPVFKKTLYIAQKEENYVLTDDENTANKVNEIEVGYNPDYKCQGFNISYKFYYKMDCGTSDISCSEDIQIGKLSIYGKDLIKLCDRMVDGKQKEIIIEKEDQHHAIDKDYAREETEKRNLKYAREEAEKRNLKVESKNESKGFTIFGVIAVVYFIIKLIYHLSK